jgi:hypothetical protein
VTAVAYRCGFLHLGRFSGRFSPGQFCQSTLGGNAAAIEAREGENMSRRVRLDGVRGGAADLTVTDQEVLKEAGA